MLLRVIIICALAALNDSGYELLVLEFDVYQLDAQWHHLENHLESLEANVQSFFPHNADWR